MPNEPFFKENNNEPAPLTDEQAWILLNSYLDDELTLKEREQLNAFLAHNPGWQQELEELRRTSQLLRADSEVEPPSRLRSAILASTVQRRTLRARLQAFWISKSPVPTWAVASGAVMVAALLLAPWLHNQERAQTSGVVARPLHVAQSPHRVPVPFSSRTPHARLPKRARASDNRTASFPSAMLAQLVAPLRANPIAASAPKRNELGASSKAPLTRTVLAKPAVSSHRAQPHLATSASMGNTAHDVQMARTFSPLPGMDQIDQPAFAQMANPSVSTDSLPPSSTTSGDKTGSTSVTKIGGGGTTAAGASATSLGQASMNVQRPGNDAKTTKSQEADTPLAYMAFLPPDALKFRPTTAIKQELSQRNLGLNHLAVESTEERKPRFVVVSAHF